MNETFKKNESSEGVNSYGEEVIKFFNEHSFELVPPVETEDESDEKRYVNKSRAAIEKDKEDESIDMLKSPDGLNRYFESVGFKSTEPVSVVEKDGTILYISSGVQIIDPVIQAESKIPDEKIFVAQPVIRSQFIDSIKSNVSTSFINLSTESINNGPTDHFDSIRKWFYLLKSIGINPNEITIVEKSTNQRWGKRKFTNFVLKFFYQNVEIGDAVYIPTMPQDSRPPISISDIGFGLERLNAIAKDSQYYNEIVQNNPEMVGIDKKVLDYTRTLTLIASSGVEPSNSGHGYRFRLFAKRLVPEILGSVIDVKKLISFFFDEWDKWGTLSVDKDRVTVGIAREIERNLNRLILDEVNKTHKLTGIEINRPTKDFWTALKNSGVSGDEIKSLERVFNVKL